MNPKPRLLIIEDEEAILNGLVDVFVFHGYQVDSASDGEAGLQKALAGRYDLILLDVMLPGKDGFTICNEIRAADREQPLIMLTARSSDEDIITGLRLGADDYVSKPFSVHELVLRAEAVLRRCNVVDGRKRELIVAGNLRVDSFGLTGVRIDPATGAPLPGSEVQFTRREVEILRYLERHGQRAVTRGELLEQVWGYRRATEIETRTVDIHIAKLRRKIEPDYREPRYLVTLRGEGYRLMNEE